MNNVLTASRMSTLLTCQRKHYWKSEVGLVHETDTTALKFGKAMALAQEARLNGADAEGMLAAALPNDHDLDQLTAATLTGMIAGYYSQYHKDTLFKELHPEVEFNLPLPGQRTFTLAGKMDGLGVLHDGRLVLKEDKTTASDISPESDYWLRLRWNTQLFQYVLAAREIGWDVQCVIYDVLRKPAIRPKQVPKENRLETPAEFTHRLYDDTLTRPEFYFARREVPVLEADLDEFRQHRLTLAKMILNLRSLQKKHERPERAWPRNVSELTCRSCPYSSFCLSNITIDLAHPPEGFKVGVFNPELSTNQQ